MNLCGGLRHYKCDERAVVTSSRHAWGGVLSTPFDLDFDRRPVLIVDVAHADVRWWLKVRVKGRGDYYVQGDTSKDGIQVLDLTKALRRRYPDLELKGSHCLWLMVGPSGKVGARVEVRSIRAVCR